MDNLSICKSQSNIRAVKIVTIDGTNKQLREYSAFKISSQQLDLGEFSNFEFGNEEEEDLKVKQITARPILNFNNVYLGKTKSITDKEMKASTYDLFKYLKPFSK